MASGEVNLPPGFVLDKPNLPPGFVLDGPKPKPFLNPAGEGIANLATGAVAAPVSGFAGIAGSILPGPQGQGADWQQKTQQALTYQPRSQEAQQGLNTLTAPLQYLANKADQAGGAVTDATGSPALGAATNAAIQFAPMVAGKTLAKARPSVEQTIARRKAGYEATASRGSVKAETWERARAEGYVVPPSTMGGSFWGDRVESIGGKAALKQQAEIHNQEITNKIVRREAGLGENDPITPQTLDQARVPMEAPYREIAALSKMAAKKLELLKQARFDAKASWKQYGRSSDPKVLAEAKKLDAKAEKIEGLLDDEAKLLGREDLAPKLREARVALAKNHAAENALNLGDGNIDTKVIGRMYDNGAKLTGGLETIGRFDQAFSQFTRETSKVPAPGISKVEAMVSALAGAGGAAAAGPWGMLAAAVPIAAPPVARSLAFSRLMQPSTGLKPYSPGLGLRASLNLTDQGITDPAALIMMSEEQRKRLVP